MAPHFQQSLPLCYSLAAIGGILEVGSTAVLAVPDAREKEGVVISPWLPQVALVTNVVMQLIGSLASNLFATWFGPVSVVAPIYFSAALVSNMVMFGFILGLEFFDRTMCVGTYVIAIGTVLLQVVGPEIQDNQDIGQLLGELYSSIWFCFLLCSMAVSTLFLTLGITKYGQRTRVFILLVARSTSFTLNLTVSRAFLMNPSHLVLVLFVAIKLISGSIYTYAIVVQSTTVNQARFVPLNATLIILVNAITGVVIWEDWRVISSWLGYVCVFLLLALGCDLLLSAPLLTNDNPAFGTVRQANDIFESITGMVGKRLPGPEGVRPSVQEGMRLPGQEGMRLPGQERMQKRNLYTSLPMDTCENDAELSFDPFVNTDKKGGLAPRSASTNDAIDASQWIQNSTSLLIPKSPAPDSTTNARTKRINAWRKATGFVIAANRIRNAARCDEEEA